MNRTDKTVAFSWFDDEKEYGIIAAIKSVDEDFIIENMESTTYVGFTYEIGVTSHPALPEEITVNFEGMTFIVFLGDCALGVVRNSYWSELPDEGFFQHLKVNVLEILLLNGDEGVYH
ncbi:hypothetical protein INP83_11465 [Mucilaginibacter sp. 21P]|uniref:hypothetical protein n=1 Tax=Mucilaginibacter sp. 21P TaxID=2778902 RepID=UPI001C57DAB5|nr:hypothetical protein [Mucilaginibacter sp. 21P]QXV63727.1 hypothetical protein INP83_11465 [Mucilaginibacter sp. 21P]